MRYFMGKDACQFRLAFHEIDQALIDVDKSTRGGKGVDRRTTDDGKPEIEENVFTVGENSLAEESQITVGTFILKQQIRLLEFIVKLFPQLLFVLDRESRTGRCRLQQAQE